jgi:flagellar hook-basal body complex protein FliE
VAIPPIGAAGISASGIGSVAPLKPLTTAGNGVGQSSGGFMQMLDGVQATQNKADGLALQAATGDLADVHAYTIAATEASLATELTVAVRNRAVEAFNEIMRMPV